MYLSRPAPEPMTCPASKHAEGNPDAFCMKEVSMYSVLLSGSKTYHLSCFSKKAEVLMAPGREQIKVSFTATHSKGKNNRNVGSSQKTKRGGS